MRSHFVALLFCTAIALPAIGGVFGWDIPALEEGRAAGPPAKAAGAKEPSKTGPAAEPNAGGAERGGSRLDVERWTAALRERAASGFGFRNALLRANAEIHTQLLHSSTTPLVVLGRDDWLYLADEEAMDSHRNLRPFDRRTLDGFRRLLEAQHRSFAARGIPFLLVIAPDKASIETQGVPERFRPREGSQSRLDQLVTELAAKESPLSLLDLRPVLRAARAEGPVYLRSDTHWNDYGAWVAYRAITERLRTLVEGLEAPRPRSEFEEGEQRYASGDLARMLGSGPSRDEIAPRWQARFAPGAAALVSLLPLREADVDAGKVFVSVSRDQSAPRALVFRDSFGSALIPLLSEHFAKVHWVWHSSFEFERDARAFLAVEAPDVVIAILAERRLMKIALQPPKLAAGRR